RVITHRYNRVRSMLSRVLQHQLESILARLFAKVGQYRDVSPDDRLQRSTQIPDDAARPDHDSPYDSHVPDDLVTRQLICRAHHNGIYATIHSLLLLDSHLLVRFYTVTIRAGQRSDLLRSVSGGSTLLFLGD